MITKTDLDAKKEDSKIARVEFESLLAPGARLPESDFVQSARTAVAIQLEVEKRPLRVAIAQTKPYASVLEHNKQDHLKAIDRAEQEKAELLVFPEQSLAGYFALDNFTRPDFIRAVTQALKDICKYTEGKSVAVVVGVPRASKGNGEVSGKPFNSAVVIQDGKIIGASDKSLLPEYGIFFDQRYFQPAQLREPIIINGRKIGVQICEDLWDSDYPTKVADELVKKGAELLVNISASPFEIGKYEIREALVSNAAKSHRVGVVYVNMVGANDNKEGEVVTDGRSMMANADGQIIAMAKAFEEDFVVADIHSAKEVSLPRWRAVAEVREALILGIRDYFRRNGFSRAYIGLSGGIDSTVVAALAVAALGAENVTGVTMPSHITSDETKSDALELARRLGMKCLTRSIKKQYEAWLEGATETHQTLAPVTRQNQQARIRGQILFEMANQDRGALVLTTGNKTEITLGYCTMYGDMCGALNPMGDLLKHMVWDLARFENELAGREVIPQSIIDRIPTAELEKDQTDEKGLGAPYSELDHFVKRAVEDRASREVLIADFTERRMKDPQAFVDLNLWRLKTAEWKRRQMAPAIKVTKLAFDDGFRYPMIKDGHRG